MSEKLIFLAFFVSKFILTCPIRCQNISNQVFSLLKIIAYHYKQFIAFEPIHLGLTVVIYWADLTEILNFWSFLANESM